MNFARFAVGLLTGLVCGFAVAMIVNPAPPAPPTGPHGTGADVPAAQPGAAPAAAADLGPIEAQLQHLGAAVRRIEARLDTIGAPANPDRTLASGPAPMIDGDAIVSAIEAAEQRKEAARLAGLGDDQLRVEFAKAMEQRDYAAAKRVAEARLARNLTPEQRAFAKVDLGMAIRETEGADAALRLYREVVDETGVGSRAGAHAASMTVWTILDQPKGDCERALQYAGALLQSGIRDRTSRLNMRRAVAMLYDKLGDPVRARAEVEALVRECGDDPDLSWIVESSRRILDRK